MKHLRQYIRQILLTEWHLANDKNLMLDREGMEKSDRDNVSSYFRSMGLIESRFKQMSKSKFTGLKAHLANAPFLDADAGADYDGEYDTLGSDAQDQLIYDLNEYLDDHFGVGEITITIQVNHFDMFLSMHPNM